MKTIKSYTNIEQSQKLAEILPLESADMWYWEWPTAPSYNNWNIRPMFHKGDDIVNIPCWSLAALLNIIPKRIKGYNVLRIDISENDTSIWYDEIGYGVNNNLPDITMEFAVDACVAMIEKLHELKLL